MFFHCPDLTKPDCLHPRSQTVTAPPDFLFLAPIARYFDEIFPDLEAFILYPTLTGPDRYQDRFMFGFVVNLSIISFIHWCILIYIHTLRVHYAHTAANLNSGYSKYAKVARVHYFCTIALRTCRAVLTRAWASRTVDLRERRVDLFSKRVVIFCW